MTVSLYDGKQMPRLGLGTWKVRIIYLGGKVDKTIFGAYKFLKHLIFANIIHRKAPAEKTKAAVKTAVKAGYRMIDCANDYDNEHVIGEAFQELFQEGVVKR